MVHVSIVISCRLYLCHSYMWNLVHHIQLLCCFFAPFGVKVMWSICLCLFVSLSVCPLSYLTKPHVHISPHFLYLLSVAVALSSSDDSATCFVLLVLWVTSCFHTGLIEWMGENQRRGVCLFQFTRWRYRRKCLPYPTLSFHFWYRKVD